MFSPLETYVGNSTYQLLPFRFRRHPSFGGEVLAVNEVGEHVWLQNAELRALVGKQLMADHPRFWDLEGRHFLVRDGEPVPYTTLAAQYRTRKSYVTSGPALHIFVVTLRCNHTCQYCQVSRQVEGESASRFDMSEDDAALAIEHVLASPAPVVTVEFQGGEPLLAFPLIRFVVESLALRAAEAGKQIRYVITSVLQHLDDDKLAFIKAHAIELSTSLDGPAHLHNRNRPLPSRDSYERTLAGIARARMVLGEHAVAALTTITKESLAEPERIIDTYKALGFHSIYLRPLSPYGFASRSTRQEYPMRAFIAFYRRAFDYLLTVNKAGYAMDEAYAALLLRSICTPFAHGHADLRSPAGAGFGVRVYNYDGKIYASDESRMLAEMGDETFCLGHVGDSYDAVSASPAMELLAAGAVAESIPGCADCAYLPYCGSDPIDSYRRQGDVIGHRPTSAFCERQMAMFDLIFEKLRAEDEDDVAVLTSWVNRRAPNLRGRNGTSARSEG